jgi:hypothetical protein
MLSRYDELMQILNKKQQQSQAVKKSPEQMQRLKMNYKKTLVNPTVKPIVKPFIKPHEIEKLSKKGLAFFLHKKGDLIEDYRTLKRYSKGNLTTLALRTAYK